MYVDLMLAGLIALVLLGLTRTTESLLDLRQRERDRGKQTKIYL